MDLVKALPSPVTTYSQWNQLLMDKFRITKIGLNENVLDTKEGYIRDELQVMFRKHVFKKLLEQLVAAEDEESHTPVIGTAGARSKRYDCVGEEAGRKHYGDDSDDR